MERQICSSTATHIGIHPGAAGIGTSPFFADHGQGLVMARSVQILVIECLSFRAYFQWL